MKPTVSVSRYGAAAQPQRAGGRVERVEEPVADADLGAGERVQQRGLAGVGVADERDRGQRGALALGALHRARALDVLQAPPQRRDAVAGEAAVGLDLGLPRPPRADARRRGARGGSTGRACARGCTRAGPARPGACPRRCRRGRRRCRGSRSCGPRPAARAPASRLRSWRAVSSSSQAIRFASALACRVLRLGDLAGAEVGVRVRAARAAGPAPRRPPRRRCAAARRARRGRRPPGSAAMQKARWRARWWARPVRGRLRGVAGRRRCDRCGFYPSTLQSRTCNARVATVLTRR